MTSLAEPKPRLLCIAPVMPAAGGNGLAMRQGQFLRAYAVHFRIDLAVIPLAGPADANSAFARRHVTRLQVFPTTGLDTQFSLLRRVRDQVPRLTAFAAYGKPSIQARLTANVQAAFASWIAGQDYDLIHIGRLYLLGLPIPHAAPCMVDADEDDERVFTRIAAQASRPDEAGWWRVEAANAARHAALHVPRVDHVFAAGAADARALQRYGKPVTVIPNSYAAPRTPPRRPGTNLLFVATLGYRPNAAGLAWFLKYCWPRLRKTMPGVKLDVIGGGGTLHTQNRMFRHGWVRDLTPFYAQAGAVIVPVLAGGGSRIKLLEAAAHGCPIIATRIGAEGSRLQAGRDLLLEDNPGRFIRAVRQAMRQPQKLGTAARRAVARHHHPARWQQRIVAIARSLAL